MRLAIPMGMPGGRAGAGGGLEGRAGRVGASLEEVCEVSHGVYYSLKGSGLLRNCYNGCYRGPT
jgi:hypothetical protein